MLRQDWHKATARSMSLTPETKQESSQTLSAGR
jgi:hypothetical protein